MLRGAFSMHSMLARGAIRSVATYSSRVIPASPAPIPASEPDVPIMKTAIPGERSVEIAKAQGNYQDPRAVMLVQDLDRSIGNYFADADGNMLLDTWNHISSIAVGYNNPELLEAARSDQWIKALVNRPSLGTTPPDYWPDLLENSLMTIAPKGLDQVFTAMCGTCAVECALKAAFMAHQHKMRGGAPFTEEELTSCMKNLPPGSPNLSIMSFQGGFHGRLLGALSTTRSKAIHKVDLPAFDWPVAPFPQIKYPLEQHAAHNAAEEERCIQAVRDTLIANPNCIAIVIEPIQGEGGDNEASPSFYRALREVTLELDRFMVVDEVQTGGGNSGTWWVHEQWGLETPPDAVTFAKKLQTAGFYHNINLRPSEAYRNFNTWLGDPVRAMMAGKIIEIAKRDNLLENSTITGKFLKDELLKLSEQFPGLISNVRGRGTFMAFDAETPEKRDALVYNMRQAGVQTGGCGVRSIRLRPQLVFTPTHAGVYLDTLEKVVKQMS